MGNSSGRQEREWLEREAWEAYEQQREAYEQQREAHEQQLAREAYEQQLAREEAFRLHQLRAYQQRLAHEQAVGGRCRQCLCQQYVNSNHRTEKGNSVPNKKACSTPGCGHSFLAHTPSFDDVDVNNHA